MQVLLREILDSVVECALFVGGMQDGTSDEISHLNPTKSLRCIFERTGLCSQVSALLEV